MQFNQLGSSDLQVSEICLGTMTFGIQNTQQDANDQLDYAVDYGINFIDTAEMYPIPPNEATYADTERFIGNWLAANQDKREKLVLMTKIAGSGLAYIRDASPISSNSIAVALDESLKRLQTDYVDVYQLHWPNRTSPHFAKHWPWRINPQDTDIERERDGMRDIVKGIGEAIDVGKIRHWGLSDDTPWGIHTFLNLCQEMGVPKPVSIQNEFSLLHLKDWPYLIETCVFENIAYLPWSPLATGLLTGKYQNDERPKGSRWTFVQRQGLFRNTTEAHEATARYMEVAERAKITPAQLALAWCKQVPGVTSTIIGATSVAQLKENIEAFEISLTEDTKRQINQVIKRYPMAF
ncbi:aldo/keto reductase [uncultured Alteromonas sp.]|jgi:aryl-alcohol dehydrogenase-like predicted oxidoreductase|uniref:aldo/keto reductase n=1 Tax=uncultured Alteromonas sp. TaxID=179113 RepID=UPI0025EAEDCB|nr:aldo/keto reductase [uncultured Alteromonas sp.]